MLLEIRQLVAGYSVVPVLHDVSVALETGAFVAIVGPNGAGKSTLFKTISGSVPVMSGNIRFDGHDLLQVPAAQRPHLGIAHVPEGRQVFASMSVLENLEMGAHTAVGQRNWTRNLERIYEWFPVLKTRSRQLAGTLSGGEQQMLAIGRGLASSPRLLMLDEPSMGLSPAIADFIFERLLDIRRETTMGILLVEQRVAEALQYADHGCVLETGRVVLSGTHQTLQADDRVRRAYLGM